MRKEFLTKPKRRSENRAVDSLCGRRKYPCYAVEIGINHNGDIDIAKKLIAAGCNSEFQKRTIESRLH
jgi:sialic acid synthase SpsE